MNLWKQTKEQLLNGNAVVLITVLKSVGSTPRDAGAKMIALQNGNFTGTIGGGTVEHEAQVISKKLFQTKVSHVEKFCLSPNKAADLGMICGGDLTVFFQYIEPTLKNQNLFTQITDFTKEVSEKWLALKIDGQTWDATIYAQKSDLPLIKLTQNSSRKPEYIETENIACYVEPLATVGMVYVFGAGHLARALVPLLSTVEFRCIVMDDRLEFADPTLFPEAEQVIFHDFSDVSMFSFSELDFVVIITRGHKNDYEVLSQVLYTKAGYIGMVGSRKKIAATFDLLRSDGVTEERLSFINTPIGLPIQAETPGEIAVSITAELIQKRAQKLKY